MDLKHAKTRLLDLDTRGCVYLNHFSHIRVVAAFFKWISRLGDGIFWYLMLALVWALQGLFYGLQMLYLLAAGSIGTLIYKLLKHKTTRPRPYQVHQVIVLGERPLDHFSFPSGHTLHAVMATLTLGYIQPILLCLMAPFTCLVAASRMVLGLHYPSDVAVGAIIGAVMAVAIVFFASILGISL